MTSEEAIDFFKEKKGSCSQAIFAAYNEKLNLGKIDYDTCMKIASPFCGGIANTGNICGTLNGALMILGLKYGVSTTDEISMEEGMKVIKISQQLLDEFKEINGSILCKDLLNHSLKTNADIQHALESGAFDKCPKYVEDTSKILDKLL
jgi:C_GCAxxG_C_C family probable redox protein